MADVLGFTPSAATQADELRALTSVLIERMQFARAAGLSFGGDRDMYKILGYDEIITPAQYRARYRRGGLAKRIIEAYPKATWRGGVELVEDEDPKKKTAFEQACRDLDARLKMFSVLQRTDILASLSTFAALLIGAAGDLSTELPRGAPEKLLYLTPFMGGGGTDSTGGRQTNMQMGADATIAEFDLNPQSERFGLPVTYQLKRVDITSENFQKPVHWTRIVHVAEGLLEDEVYGVPCLEPVWNLLDDLDKVTGGGAEAFWLRANQGMHLNVDKDVSMSEADRVELKKQADGSSNQLRRMIRTRGVDVTPLGSDVANFAAPADAIITQISGTKAIPKRILSGSEMGELASSQDRNNWKDQVSMRQTAYAEPYILRQLVDRLIKDGYLPTPKTPYQVRWSSIEVLMAEEKYAGAAAWANTNATQGAPVFTAEEIRDHWYGLDPLTDAQIEKEKEIQAPPEPPPGAMVPGAPGAPPVPAVPKAAAAADDEMASVLEAAIVANNTDVIDRILGMRHPRTLDRPTDRIVATRHAGGLGSGDVEGHEFHGNQWTGGIGGSGNPRPRLLPPRSRRRRSSSS